MWSSLSVPLLNEIINKTVVPAAAFMADQKDVSQALSTRLRVFCKNTEILHVWAERPEGPSFLCLRTLLKPAPGFLGFLRTPDTQSMTSSLHPPGGQRWINIITNCT